MKASVFVELNEKQLNKLIDFLLEVEKLVDEGKLKGKRMSYDFSEFQEF